MERSLHCHTDVQCLTTRALPRSPSLSSSNRTRHPKPKHDFADTIAELFQSIKHDPLNRIYVDASGQPFFSNYTIWKKPLGKKVLIVDIDTRVPTDTNQILNPEPINFETLNTGSGGGLVSAAILNHYLYALIHGYDYKYYQAHSISNHHDTWIMPHVFRKLIPDYQFVVAMDADALVPHLEVPLEWMFNRWGIHRHTSMALPWDTMEHRDGREWSLDSKGLRVLNTGFVVAQNSPLTREILESWRDCTSETKYPGCSEWRYNWSHEQRAFSEYIRYDYNITPETIVSIDCDDAVGWPGFLHDVEHGNPGISDCSGNFIRHYTIGKDKVKPAGMLSVMNPLAGMLQTQLLRNQKTAWVKEKEREEALQREMDRQMTGKTGIMVDGEVEDVYDVSYATNRDPLDGRPYPSRVNIRTPAESGLR
jgi:hypothetical protein